MGAPGEIVYSFRNRSKVVLQRGRSQWTQMSAYRDGAIATITGGGSSYSLIGPDGAAQISGGAVTAPSGIARYQVLSTSIPDTLALGEGWQERWTLKMPDGTVRTVLREAVLGRFQLQPPMVEADIVAGEYPDLLQNWGSSESLQEVLDSTWHWLMRRCVAAGDWPDVLLESGDLFDWYRHEALSRLFRAMLSRQDAQRWRDLWEYHQAQSEAEAARVVFTVDRDRDGQADELGKQSRAVSVYTNIPRTTHLPRGRY